MFTKADIEKYFMAEKQESLLFVAIGALAIIAALIAWITRQPALYRGAAIPFLLIGLLLGVVGFTVYRRSDADRMRNVYAYDLNPGELKAKEIPRMETVMKNFLVYRWTEIFLLAAGLVLYFMFMHSAANQFWRGLGGGLAIMAFAALSADFFAERRGAVYLEGLQQYTAKTS